MNLLLDTTFDFSVRIVELSNYLDEEQLVFPLKNRLLACCEDLCVRLRTAKHLPNEFNSCGTHAYKLALETEYLLELMVKTGVLGDMQSIPILTECRQVIEKIDDIFHVTAS